MDPLRAILICHSCAEEGGSEARMSWNWITALAEEGVELLVVHNGADPTSAAGVGTPPPRVELLDVRSRTIPRRGIPVPLYTAIDYWIWQSKVRRVVKRRLRQRHTDLIHHLSWGSLNYGSFMVKLGTPLVMGPMGGGTQFPKEYLDVLPTSSTYERARNRFVDSVRFNPFARRTVRHAAMVIASNPETAALVRSIGGENVPVMMDDGVANADIHTEPVPQDDDATLRLVWISRMQEFKALAMALDAVELAAKEVDIELTVLGDGPDRPGNADRLEDLESRGLVRDLGWVDRATMSQVYSQSHVMLYNSLRDNGSAPLHDATRWGLPAIVLDHQGPGLIAAESWAVKIALSNPIETPQDLADAIVALALDRERRVAMGHAALAAARANTWQARADKLIGMYKNLLAQQ
ncbi:MAG: glycosyltransferase [Acidimicrobiales bacterium]|nr:glycosyltransferase [Acidimicrobiales bacterium]